MTRRCPTLWISLLNVSHSFRSAAQDPQIRAHEGLTWLSSWLHYRCPVSNNQREAPPDPHPSSSTNERAEIPPTADPVEPDSGRPRAESAPNRPESSVRHYCSPSHKWKVASKCLHQLGMRRDFRWSLGATSIPLQIQNAVRGNLTWSPYRDLLWARDHGEWAWCPKKPHWECNILDPRDTRSRHYCVQWSKTSFESTSPVGRDQSCLCLGSITRTWKGSCLRRVAEGDRIGQIEANQLARHRGYRPRWGESKTRRTFVKAKGCPKI